jgi:hypothetical protein
MMSGLVLLKKSQIDRRQFACSKKTDRRLPIRYGLNHVTGVAREFYRQTMRFPTCLRENRAYSQTNFNHQCKKPFSTASVKTRTLARRLTPADIRPRSPSAAMCQYCCKSPKWPGANFYAVKTRCALATRLKRADDIQRLCRLSCLFFSGRLMLKLANGVFYIPSHRRRKTSIGEHLLEPQEPAFLPGLFY